jgi:hypothetical protein
MSETRTKRYRLASRTWLPPYHDTLCQRHRKDGIEGIKTFTKTGNSILFYATLVALVHLTEMSGYKWVRFMSGWEFLCSLSYWDALLGNGWLNTLPSVTLSTRSDVRCLITTILQAYPAQRRHEQQYRNSWRRWCLYGSPEIIKEEKFARQSNESVADK